MQNAIKASRNAERQKMRRQYKVVQSTGLQLVVCCQHNGILLQDFIGGSYPSIKDVNNITKRALDYANEKTRIEVYAVGDFRCANTLNAVINGDHHEGECVISDEWSVHLASIPQVQRLAENIQRSPKPEHNE